MAQPTHQAGWVFDALTGRLCASLPGVRLAVVGNSEKGLLQRLLGGVLVMLGGILFLALCVIAPTLVVTALVLGGPAVVLVWARRPGSGARDKVRR